MALYKPIFALLQDIGIMIVMRNTLASLGLFPVSSMNVFRDTYLKTFLANISYRLFLHSVGIYQIIYNILLTFSWPEEEQQASALGE